MEPVISISLGAGVQSSCMALMAAAGELRPMPNFALFADTGWEPKAVYEWLDTLRALLPFPIHVVGKGNLRNDTLALARATNNGRFVTIPWFFSNGGMGRRQCTKDYKVAPMIAELRVRLGYKPRKRIPIGSVESWIGISLDECHRMKPSSDRWITHRWPLVELGMKRADCQRWLSEHGYKAPGRSACLGCPYHSNAYWRKLKMESPDEWQETVEVDTALRERGPRKGVEFLEYMHSSRTPLADVDLRTDVERGQTVLFEDGFGNECEGLCGV